MERVILITVLLIYGILYVNRYQLHYTHIKKTTYSVIDNNFLILNNNIIENEFIYKYSECLYLSWKMIN